MVRTRIGLQVSWATRGTHRGRILPAASECHGSGSVPRRRLSRRMYRLKECHESSRVGRTKVFAVSRHVSPPLDHLADQRVLCTLSSKTVQLRTPLVLLP